MFLCFEDRECSCLVFLPGYLVYKPKADARLLLRFRLVLLINVLCLFEYYPILPSHPPQQHLLELSLLYFCFYTFHSFVECFFPLSFHMAQNPRLAKQFTGQVEFRWKVGVPDWFHTLNASVRTQPRG